MGGAEPLHAADEFAPVRKIAARAFGEDALGELGANAFDHLQFGLVGSIEIDEMVRAVDGGGSAEQSRGESE